MEHIVKVLEVMAKEKDHKDFAVEVLSKVKSVNVDVKTKLDPASQVTISYSWNGRRFITTPGRFIVRQLSVDCSKNAVSLQKFSDALTAMMLMDGCKLSLITGTDISMAYQEGVGGSSCMTGRDRQSLIRLYEENEGRIFMVKLANGSVTARALVFTDINGQKLGDRIYPNSGWHILVMRAWMREHGIIPREGDSVSSSSQCHFECHRGHLVVVNKPSNGRWPYLDTFYWGMKVNEKGTHWLLSNFSKCEGEIPFEGRTRFKSNGGSSEEIALCETCGLRPPITGRRVIDIVESDKRGGVAYRRGRICEDCFYQELKEGTTVKCACGNSWYVSKEIFAFLDKNWKSQNILRNTTSSGREVSNCPRCVGLSTIELPQEASSKKGSSWESVYGRKFPKELLP